MTKCEAHDDFVRHWGETRSELLGALKSIETKVDDVSKEVHALRAVRKAKQYWLRVGFLTTGAALAAATLAWRFAQ